MRGLRVCRGLADYLIERCDALQYLQPAIHAERQHSLFDGRLLDLGGARALHDQLSEFWGHVQDLVQPLTTTEPRSVTLLASLTAKNREVFHLGVEGDLVHVRLGCL